MQLFLALECIHCLPARCFSPEVLENCESTVCINKSRTLPGQIICQLKEGLGLWFHLEPEVEGLRRDQADWALGDVTAANQGKDL